MSDCAVTCQSGDFFWAFAPAEEVETVLATGAALEAGAALAAATLADPAGTAAPGVVAAACGNTARIFPKAFITRVSRNSSMESASSTDSPCHMRAWPV